jgi:hypothetical protein
MYLLKDVGSFFPIISRHIYNGGGNEGLLRTSPKELSRVVIGCFGESCQTEVETGDEMMPHILMIQVALGGSDSGAGRGGCCVWDT